MVDAIRHFLALVLIDLSYLVELQQTNTKKNKFEELQQKRTCCTPSKQKKRGQNNITKSRATGPKQSSKRCPKSPPTSPTDWRNWSETRSVEKPAMEMWRRWILGRSSRRHGWSSSAHMANQSAARVRHMPVRSCVGEAGHFGDGREARARPDRRHGCLPRESSALGSWRHGEL